MWTCCWISRNGGSSRQNRHNDTKINNVMLDRETDKAVCVIDLDTVMPGERPVRFRRHGAHHDLPCSGR